MKSLIPQRYYKNIFEINYDRLKRDNIKCLLFDLDNTIAPVNIKSLDDKYINLIEELKKDFKVILISNALPKRTKLFANYLNIDYLAMAWKPHKWSYSKIMTKYNLNNHEIATIGDQIFTDIRGANNSNIMGILVDPISDVDSIFTKKNRRKEKKFFNNNNIKRGEYYE